MLLIDYRDIIISAMRSNIQLSIADFLIAVTSARSATIILPVTIIVFFFIVKNDFNIFFVLQEKNRKKLWFKQIYKIVLFSVFITIYVSICTYFIGALYSTSYINWNKPNSIFNFENKGLLLKVSFLKVIIYFFLVYSIKMIVMSSLALLIYWITDKKIISLVIIMAINIFERHAIFLKIFNRVISIDYKLWANKQKIILGILYGILLIFIITLIGKHISKGKEFLNE
ncbi:hypothetical protein [Clostridium ihumii]|uniref:hypothetical protein n=1 Tax=Clostridium ihumii TaxID=1470356 RepID=UPI003D345426